MREGNHIMSKRRAFTLVELLVVIGIIAILASFLLPTLGKARKVALRTQCATQLRSIATAVLMYTNDNKGWFPGPADGHQFSPDDWAMHDRDRLNPRPRAIENSALARYMARPFGIRQLSCPS